MRHPVGPLPASIYWRRRFVVLVVLAAIAALVIWLTTGGGGGSHAKGKQPVPVESITPGAGPSGSAISTRPGGTGGTATGGDTSGGATPSSSPSAGGSQGSSDTTTDGGGDSGSGGTGGTGGSDVSLSGGATDGGTGGTGGGAGGAASGGGSATGGAAAGGGTGGGTVPVNTSAVRALPICPTSKLSLELASAQNAYQPKERPRFELTVRNSGAACRADLGRAASVITVSASSDGRVWSSGDCPTDRSAKWVGIPAGSSVTETFVWDRSRSTQQCPSPSPSGSATDGVYLVQADLSGVSGTPVTARASFRLES
ncbi:hypothetical protein [Peterkaempfera sp. SMS 1(5)a]